MVQRDGGWQYRFDPEANRQRRPVDTMTLLARIAAPTLIVRGEWSPVLPPDLAAVMLSAIPRATLTEIPGVYHHLVLDRPEAFVQALDDFLPPARPRLDATDVEGDGAEAERPPPNVVQPGGTHQLGQRGGAGKRSTESGR